MQDLHTQLNKHPKFGQFSKLLYLAGLRRNK